MVFVGRRWQRSQLLVASLAVRADGAGPRPQVGRIDVFFRARIIVRTNGSRGRSLSIRKFEVSVVGAPVPAHRTP